MKIRGEYRDIVRCKNNIVKDSGWQSNTIVQDCGKFLTALMKKEYEKPVGIEYIAVGGGSNEDSKVFREKVVNYFQQVNKDEISTPLLINDTWVWAKPVIKDNIVYVDPEKNDNETNEITYKLKLSIEFSGAEPSEDGLTLKEFALLGIFKNDDDEFDTDRMFLINYAHHGNIFKDKNMTLKRTIMLTFPLNHKEDS